MRPVRKEFRSLREWPAGISDAERVRACRFWSRLTRQIIRFRSAFLPICAHIRSLTDASPDPSLARQIWSVIAVHRASEPTRSRLTIAEPGQPTTAEFIKVVHCMLTLVPSPSEFS